MSDEELEQNTEDFETELQLDVEATDNVIDELDLEATDSENDELDMEFDILNIKKEGIIEQISIALANGGATNKLNIELNAVNADLDAL